MAFGPAYTDVPITYMDWARRQDPDGAPAQITELLAKFTPLVQDAVVLQSNLERSHRLTQRRTQPTPTWRGFNQGVIATKSETSQVEEAIGNLEDIAMIDKDLADLNGNSARFMISEASAHIAGMAEEMEDETWHGDGTNPNGFTGFYPRSTTLSGINSSQVIDASSGTLYADPSPTPANVNHGLWMVTWSDMTAFMMFAKGLPNAGLQMRDDGERWVPTPVVATGSAGTLSQGQMLVYQQSFKWMTGLAVRDPRFIVRAANVDDTALQAGNFDLVKLLIHMQHRLFKQGVGKCCIYTTRDVATALDVQAQAQGNVNLTHREYGGEYVLHFRNMPIRECDMLYSTDANVT